MMNGLPDPEWYEVLTDFNGNRNDFLEDRFEEILENKDDDEADELREQFGTRYDNRRSASQHRKNALTTVMGAFLNRHGDNGSIYQQTGWEFRELEPFEMDDELEADILLAKPEEGKTLLVLLLPKRESPDTVVQKSKEAVEGVENNLSIFGYQTDRDEIHSAIVVNPSRDEETNRAIDAEGGAYKQEIFVWRVFDVEDGSDDDQERKKLDYYADLDSQLQQTGPNMHLLDVLEDEVTIQRDRGILPDFFITSHHSIYLEHIVGHVVQRREDKDDGPLTHFSREEIVDYIEDTLFERGVSEEASDKTDHLLERWEQMEAITGIKDRRNDIDGTEFYRFTVNGKLSQDNVIEAVTDNYLEQTSEFYIEVEAMREALDDYRDEYGEQSTLRELASSGS